MSRSWEGSGPSGEQHPPSTNTPCLYSLSGKIFVCLRQGFLKASAFSPASFLQETDEYENKTPNQSKCPQPTRSVFLPPHSQKANICSDLQYFRWPWQKKAPLFFKQGVFSFRAWRRFTRTPAGNAHVALWQQNSSLHPKPWSGEEAAPEGADCGISAGSPQPG